MLPDFDIEINASNGIIRWKVSFADFINNNSNNADTSYVISVAHELKNSLEKLLQQRRN